jgi:hypothetical protein
MDRPKHENIWQLKPPKPGPWIPGKTPGRSELKPWTISLVSYAKVKANQGNTTSWDTCTPTQVFLGKGSRMNGEVGEAEAEKEGNFLSFQKKPLRDRRASVLSAGVS